MLIESGADPLLLADRMGYEKVTTTLEIYSHLYPDKGQALAATLDVLKARRDHAAASSVLVDDPPTPEPDF